MRTKPLNNNVLIEVLRDDDGVSRTDENESLKYGRLVDYSTSPYHLTASAGVRFDDGDIAAISNQLKSRIGCIVRWEEYAEGGQTFETSVRVTTNDGQMVTATKTFALIPWWRLISYEENENE